MPFKIKLFLGLSLANLLVWANWQVVLHHQGLPGSKVISVILLGTAGLIAYFRVGWLRWLLAAFYLFEASDFGWMGFRPFSFVRLYLFYLPQIGIDLACLYCLYSREAASWFSTSSEHSRPKRIFIATLSSLCALALALPVALNEPRGFLDAVNSVSNPRKSTPIGTAELRASDPAAIFAGQLYADACLANVGHPDRVRAWAANKNLPEVLDAGIVQSFGGEGPKGQVWQAPSGAGDFWLSISSESQGCMVWVKAASAGDSEIVFKAALDRFRSFDTQWSVDKDVTTPSPRGPTHFLRYSFWTPSSNTAAVFSLLSVNESGAPFQVSFEALGGPP